MKRSYRQRANYLRHTNDTDNNRKSNTLEILLCVVVLGNNGFNRSMRLRNAISHHPPHTIGWLLWLVSFRPSYKDDATHSGNSGPARIDQ